MKTNAIPSMLETTTTEPMLEHAIRLRAYDCTFSAEGAKGTQ